MEEKLFERFRRYLHDQYLVGPADKVLLAVSGGVDSMVMMELFSRTDIPFGVAHCNFCLRGPEADEDEISVQEACARLGVPHYNNRFDTEGEAHATGESIEMAARRLRYDWFNTLCDRDGYTRIAIAHHSDDSVETFFINLIRGTGLRGLTGIHVTYGRIIRPLLFATRREISEYAHQRGIAYREDSTNHTTKYLRNKIRLGVVPRIREISPNFGRTMTQNVERLSLALKFIDHQMEYIRKNITNRVGDSLVVSLDLIDPGLPFDYVIYEMLRPYGFNTDVVNDLCHSIQTGNSGMKFFSPSHIAYLNRRHVIIRTISQEEFYQVELSPAEPKVCCLGGEISMELLDRDDIADLRQPPHIALVDADKITFPLVVRLWEEGDSFIPLGMAGRKKVSDYLIDAKVPLPDKERQLVVVSGPDIVWLADHRIDDRFKVREDTLRVLRIVKEESADPVLV